MKIKKLLAILVLVVMSVSLLQAVCPMASAFSDQRGSISLTVKDPETDSTIENASFRLYYVATARKTDTYAEYSYISPYNECNMELGDLQDSYLPVHLSAFAESRTLPYTEKASDENGSILFDGLVSGAYLIVFDGDTDAFTVSPFIVGIPLYDSEGESWVFDINATPKIDYNKPSDTEEFTYITVKKKWEYYYEHPDSITVSLLKDFKKAESVTLNEANGWTYRWDNLSKNHSWNVVEENVPKGYTVSYNTSSSTVIITNEETKTPVIDTTVDPTTGPSETSDDTTKPDDLIQTGQLKWPIPILSVTGLLLFSLGWAMLNLGKKKNG